MTHSTLVQGPHTLDVLESDSHRLMVNRIGAEPVSLACKTPSGTWEGFLHRDGQLEPPASGWANHATVMGYFLHRLLGEKSIYRGHEIRGGNHGFLRHFSFDAPAFDGNRLVYSVDPSRIPADAYPLRVGLELSYGLDSHALVVGFRFQNHESVPAHVSFGLHPGFAVSSPLTCKVHFPAGRYVRHFAPGNFLDGRTEVLDFVGGDMPWDREALPGSYLLGLQEVPDPVIVLEDSGRRTELDFRGVPYMTLWSDGGPFLCIEPCWGLPDSNPQKPFEDKVGIQVLAPGGVLDASFRILTTLS